MSKPDTRPCFKNIMMPPNLTLLQIPHDFETHLRDVKTNRATLETTLGTWEVKLQKDENGDLYSVKDWSRFIEAHSIGLLDFLLFKHNGEMSFDVMIFNRNGSPKNYHHHQEPDSCFPSFQKKIQNYSIGPKSFMLIPKKFARAHFPQTKQSITLRNPEGISYLATILVSSNSNHLIVGGWKVFAEENSIKKGDICTFELVDQSTLQVNVLRK